MMPWIGKKMRKENGVIRLRLIDYGRGESYRITLQYKFKETTFRKTSTDRLNHRMLFPILIHSPVSIKTISQLFLIHKQTRSIKNQRTREINPKNNINPRVNTKGRRNAETVCKTLTEARHRRKEITLNPKLSNTHEKGRDCCKTHREKQPRRKEKSHETLNIQKRRGKAETVAKPSIVEEKSHETLKTQKTQDDFCENLRKKTQHRKEITRKP